MSSIAVVNDVIRYVGKKKRQIREAGTGRDYRQFAARCLEDEGVFADDADIYCQARLDCRPVEGDYGCSEGDGWHQAVAGAGQGFGEAYSSC